MEQERNDWWRRAVRTLVQLIIGGSFTALVDQLVIDVPASYAPYVVIAATVVVTAAQNYAEDMGWVKAPLKSRPSAGQDPVPDHGEFA